MTHRGLREEGRVRSERVLGEERVRLRPRAALAGWWVWRAQQLKPWCEPGAHRLRHGPQYLGGTFLFLAMLPLFALSAHPLLSALLLVGLGAGQGASAVMQSTLVFLAAPPGQRAAAMAMVTTCIGIAPVGFVWVGWLAEHLGPPGAAMACAAGGFAALALTWLVWKLCLAR